MKTARAERIHIGIVGKRNAGKSSLLNTLTGQATSIVSDVKGTTTDPIYKPMEIHGLGPVIFIDTAGIDDEGSLGSLRTKKTDQVINKCDGFIYILSGDDNNFVDCLKRKNKPIIFVVSKGDTIEHKDILEKNKRLNPFVFIANNEEKKYSLLNLIREKFKNSEERTITENLVKSGDMVLLVMPQDIQAPKGRLIMPQVQTIRELLDKKALITISTVDNMGEILNTLKKSPDLIITDSQYFEEVNRLKVIDSKITSFSVLFSAYKGDIKYFLESAKVLDHPEKLNKILIAEACTHPPLEEDIGRVKIPRLLKMKLNKDFTIDFVRGDDFLNINKIEDYDLVIHCGACMFNRQNVLSRLSYVKEKNIPMTNYGVVIAYLNGILDKVSYPGS